MKVVLLIFKSTCYFYHRYKKYVAPNEEVLEICKWRLELGKVFLNLRRELGAQKHFFKKREILRNGVSVLKTEAARDPLTNYGNFLEALSPGRVYYFLSFCFHFVPESNFSPSFILLKEIAKAWRMTIT